MLGHSIPTAHWEFFQDGLWVFFAPTLVVFAQVSSWLGMARYPKLVFYMLCIPYEQFYPKSPGLFIEKLGFKNII